VDKGGTCQLRYDYFYLESGTLEKLPLKISVTRKRLPSRITCNGLPRKDPLLYDEAMRLRLRPTSIPKRPFDLVLLCLVIAVLVYLFT
jgi:hypothetical protein